MGERDNLLNNMNSFLIGCCCCNIEREFKMMKKKINKNKVPKASSNRTQKQKNTKQSTSAIERYPSSQLKLGPISNSV